MNNSIVIKGSKDGLTILVNEELQYEEFIEILKEKFHDSRNFFKQASMALAIKGIKLTARQEQQMIDIIEEYSGMKIICLVDNEEVTNARFFKARMNQEYLEKSRTGIFFKGNIRNGEVFESRNSVIILGNVNTGATVISAGNIVVLGTLKGYAFAGADNEDSCFIAAMEMMPTQLKINDIFVKTSRYFRVLRSRGPKIAFLKRERIVIDDLTKAVYANIKF